jgi:hypothetical protein
MSLVGSLEDLGLGDILQIVSLSRKSGLLLLRSDEGEGRIVFCEGLVRAAFGKGEPEDLKGLLLTGGFISEEEFDRAAETAAAHDDPVADVLAQLPNFSKERIDSLRRERVERSVFRMFGWKTGEFSFEIRDDVDERDRELLLPTGINAQYLTMEATRLGDEGEKESDEGDIEFGTIDDSADGAAVEAAPEEPESDADCEIPDGSPIPEPEEPAAEISSESGSSQIAEALAEAAIRNADPDGDETQPEIAVVAQDGEVAEQDEGVTSEFEVVEWDETEAAEAPADPARPSFGSLVVIDPDLAALEWQKSVLGPICQRVHIFQRTEAGISRIRQYLGRGETPCVLVSDSVPGDPLSGTSDAAGLIRRLRAHAPHMPIYLVQSRDDSKPGKIAAANGLLQRPADHQLANRKAWNRLEAAGAALREALANRGAEPMPPAPKSNGAAAPAAADDPATASNLIRLKKMSERLRDPSVRGEVLALILEFAAESFARAAIFMLRDDDAIGMAQLGLGRAGGPDDEAFREISISAREPAWFQEVLERREGIKAPPRNAGDRELAVLLGSAVPREAYVAPIESSQQVVALVYVDNLPGDEPIGETTSLEIVLHEAGLSLERALLERALAEAEDQGGV